MPENLLLREWSESGDVHFAHANDILWEIPEKVWPSLREMYATDWPSNIYTYYFLQNCIEWKIMEPHFQFKIYSVEGDWSDGTFVAESVLGGLPHINMDSLDPNSVRLENALLGTKLIDWSRGHLFCGIHEKQRHVVNKLKTLYSLPVKYDILTGYHWRSKESCKELEIKCPEEVFVAKLKEEHVPLIDSLWPLRYPGSDDFLRQVMRLNGGTGVFLKSDGSLCSWILKSQFSGLGMLQTVEPHQSKGYAKLVTKSLMKEMASDNMDVHASITRSNYKSVNMFKGLGFAHVSEIFWMLFDKSPSNMDEL